MQWTIGRRALVGTIAACVLALGMLGGAGRSAAQAPPLSSEDLLGLVLPAGPDGDRMPVIAWARYDAATAAGAPDVIVALLYETPAPFGTTEARRLVNRVTWNGRAYEPAIKNAPGEVLGGDLRRLGRTNWSVSIDLAQQMTDLGAIYVATYAGSGPLDHGGPGTLTLTEVLQPDGSPLWQRVTDLSERAAAGAEPSRAEHVTYRIEQAGTGPARLLATVSEASQQPAAAAGATPVSQMERFEEVYVLKCGRFRLVTRSVLVQP